MVGRRRKAFLPTDVYTCEVAARSSTVWPKVLRATRGWGRRTMRARHTRHVALLKPFTHPLGLKLEVGGLLGSFSGKGDVGGGRCCLLAAGTAIGRALGLIGGRAAEPRMEALDIPRRLGAPKISCTSQDGRE
eukprot:scaffold69116_cov32-Tisochrysis_lutea.AAC.2